MIKMDLKQKYVWLFKKKRQFEIEAITYDMNKSVIHAITL